MAKLADEIIEQIPILYKELGVYTQVAKRLSISASTVSKYVKLAREQEQLETAEKTEFKGEIKAIEEIPKPKNLEEWQKVLEWSEFEWEECKSLRTEGVV